MKKILSILAMAGILFMAMSCKTNSDDDSESKNSFPLNGTYVCKTKINGTDYTATMKLYDFENDDFYDSQIQGYDGYSGHISVVEEPYNIRLLLLTEEEKQAAISEGWYDETKNTRGKGQEFNVKISKYKNNDLTNAGNKVGINNPIELSVSKQCTGENLYFMEKGDYTKIYLSINYETEHILTFYK